MRGNLAWISLVAVAGAGLGWLIATIRPSIYQARTVLDIRSLNENILNPRDGSPIGTSGSVLPESYIQTEIKILSSDSLRKRALARLPALQHPVGTPASDPPSWWRSFFGKFEPGSVPMKALAEDAARRVKVRAVGNTRIVEVLCDARDGQLAADICNNLAKTYIEYNLESRYQSTKETGDWLQSQLDDVKRRLTKAENDLKDSSKETDFLFDSASADNPAEDKLRQLQGELSRSEAERINKESDYEVASSRPADTLPMALDAGPIREYRMRLEDLKRQQAELSATMTPEHYKVRELTMQIAEVQKALDTERDNLISRLKADYETSQRRESVFAGEYNKQAAQVSQHADKAVGYNMLKREVDSDRKLYETLLQKVDEVGLEAALRTSTISVVDPAAPPAHPYSPSVKANVAIGFFGGSILGLAFALLHLRSDRTLHGPGEAAVHLHLRELGVIPAIRNRRMRMLLSRTVTSSGGIDLSLLKPEESGLAERREMSLARNFPSSMALGTWLRIPELAEAFFGTMSSLRFATERGEQANVIVLTSPDPGEGKTTVATNLAIALSQIGRRVILVDGDLRKPSLDQIFSTSCEGGLAELLEMEESVEQAPLAKFVFHSPIPNLDVLPTKAAREGICTKLHSSRMRVLLERLRREYDNVIIDSPPMLHIADARVLGWLSDGVLLVLRARKTTKDAALAAYDCLFQDGINVLGSVLNDWNPRKNEKYSSYKSYLSVS
ncbi:MAG: polysaccharide biosynthesis tyrosine autokinase [Bryobacterales bacterium]|nr:polysaccharide biosynthesis tyrosine autokinase [Bryobacterales bacterium]